MAKSLMLFTCCYIILFNSCIKSGSLVALHNVNLFDGERYNKKVTIVIQGSKISAINLDNHYPKNAKIIDGSEKTVLPPLLNAHVHVWNKKDLKESFNVGVLGLLDMHNSDENSTFLRTFRDSLNYAYLYSSGPGATVPNGHGTQYGGNIPTINDSISPQQFVEDRINKNADYIKILLEPSMPSINKTQTEQVIKSSHRYSKICVAHISTLSDAMALSFQNINGFAHIWHDLKINSKQLNSLCQKKIFIVPTLLATQKGLELLEVATPNQPHLGFHEILEETHKLFVAGIPILAGTDAPNFDINYGDDLFKEFQLLSKANIPNIEILKTATSNIYKSFCLKEFGKLELGANANFIIVEGNPIEQLDDIKNLAEIWKNGKRIK